MAILNIISEKEDKDRLTDAAHTVFNLSAEDIRYMARIIDSNRNISIGLYYLTDRFEIQEAPLQLGIEKKEDENGNKIKRRFYFSNEKGSKVSFSKLLSKMAQEVLKLPEDQKDIKERVTSFLNNNNLEKFKSDMVTKGDISKEFVDKLFSIVLDDEVMQKFIDYDNNKDFFSVEGKKFPQDAYSSGLVRIFGKRALYNKEIQKADTPIYSGFYIPNIDEMYGRYEHILDALNLERLVDPSFDLQGLLSFNNRFEEDELLNSFNVNPKVEQELLGDMPLGLSPEEKGLYVYTKMCKLFRYDEGYFYRDSLAKGEYDLKFDKEKLESLVPGDKITCDQFSRLYANIINTRVATLRKDGRPDIVAKCVIYGLNEGHFSTGFYTDRMSCELEAINGRTQGTNDIMKSREAIEFEGINPISDKEDLIPQVMDKIYPMVLGKKAISILDYVRKTQEAIVSNPVDLTQEVDIAAKLQAFKEIAKRKDMSGNEAIQYFTTIDRLGFFGVPLEKSYIGERHFDEETGESSIKRYVLIQRKNIETILDNNGDKIQNPNYGEKAPIYLLDSDTLEIVEGSKEDIKDKLKKGLFVYEKDSRQMPGLELEDK